jgi:hypothetical protein
LVLVLCFFLVCFMAEKLIKGIFWEDFPLVSPAFLIKSTACCQFLNNTRPCNGFPDFFQSNHRQPRPCRTSLLGAWLAYDKEVSSLGACVGHVPPSRSCSVIFGVLWWLYFFCRDAFGDGMWHPRVVFLATEFLLTVALLFGCFCYVCIF